MRGADGDPEPAADDAVRAEVADRPAGDVHRAAAPAAVAGLPAEQLGHHEPRLVALGDRVAVAAMRAHDVVVGLEGRDRADGDRLLAEVRVEVAADVPEPVLLDRALLEAADRDRRLVHRLEQSCADLAHRLLVSRAEECSPRRRRRHGRALGFCGNFWLAWHSGVQVPLVKDASVVFCGECHMLDPRSSIEPGRREWFLVPADAPGRSSPGHRDLVRERGSVRGRELVDLLGVTDETVRRDLARLAEQGIVRRAHGGAIAVRPTTRRTRPSGCASTASEKIAIGHRAAELVADGSDDHPRLGDDDAVPRARPPAKRDLVVVTTAVTNAVELVGIPGTTVVMTGGVIRPITFGASGQLAAATLRELHVDQAFLAIHSVSVQRRPDLPVVRGGRRQAGDDRGRHRGHPPRRPLEVRAGGARPGGADHGRPPRSSRRPGVDPAEAAAIRDLGIELIVAEPARTTAVDPGRVRRPSREGGSAWRQGW